MTRFAVVTALALGLVGPLSPAPAEAGGFLSLQLNARNADEARAMRLGLAAFVMHQDIRTNGHVTQRGIGNGAGIAQTGRGHRAIIHQDGCNHDAAIDQRGRDHTHGVFQFGCNTSAHVSQRGQSQSGITIQYGW